MLAHRLLTGGSFIVAALALFWLDGYVGRTWPAVPAGAVLMVLLTALLVPASVELAALLRRKGIEASAAVLGPAAFAVAVTLWLGHGCELGAAAVSTVLLAGFAVALVWHCRGASPPGAMAAAGAGLLAMVYLGVAGGLFLAMRQEHAAWVVLAVLLVTKSCDIGAYSVGKVFGRHKLIPWLSPGKTWEGLVGGIALAVLVAVGFAMLSQHTELGAVHQQVDGEAVAVVRQYHLGWAALTGLLLAVIGHAGDLTMSLFKRDAAVKDSGATMPGFGGVMDIIDSPLLAAPVAYWMLRLAGGGAVGY